MAHKQRYCVTVNFVVEAGWRLDSFQLGCEYKHPTDPSVIERLDPDTVTNKRQRALLAIPKCKRKHSIETLQGALKPPVFDGGYDNLGVRVAAERGTLGYKLAVY